ncbi:selenium metabolism-associated LysR family transcriptional regulator [Geobacter sp. DSM 9736]|uniref:selenium metabolism-associated LysR family transcriptional regulator n=1 Tax=Geobacter sp. DSM 9736 TaxID=1277350 RepID=UPI000B507A9E|nr:selenium metabolism-associated LysR family transcriptional regulator [Geobacter sp. DSM 9736]SNB46057.1 transcriptional regulator, LysR family [Geobacter sp. DSM 9736]
MNLKQLEVFQAVAESGSFSKGAEASFITQSTVSQHIAALEREFGVKLLDRTGRGALLTEGGKVLLEQVQRLVAEAREVYRVMDRFKGLDDVHLRIGGSNIPGSYLIPAALPRLLARFPGIKVTVLQGDSRETLLRVIKDDVEIGVVGSRFATDECTFLPVGRDTIRLVVNRQHPWRRRRKVRLEELAAEDFILREPGSGTGNAVMEALEHAGVRVQSLRVRAYFGSNEAVKHAVAEGAGISFLSLVSVAKEIERGELAAVHVEGLAITREFFLVARAGRQLSPAAAAFENVLRLQ